MAGNHHFHPLKKNWVASLGYQVYINSLKLLQPVPHQAGHVLFSGRHFGFFLGFVGIFEEMLLPGGL